MDTPKTTRAPVVLKVLFLQAEGGQVCTIAKCAAICTDCRIKGGSEYQNNFRKTSKGGGVIFNPKIYIADFGSLKQGFLSMKLIQKSNFRVQGMFFQQLF